MGKLQKINSHHLAPARPPLADCARARPSSPRSPPIHKVHSFLCGIRYTKVGYGYDARIVVG